MSPETRWKRRLNADPSALTGALRDTKLPFVVAPDPLTKLSTAFHVPGPPAADVSAVNASFGAM